MSNIIITMKIVAKIPDRLLKMESPVVTAFVDVGMGPVTVTLSNGITWPVKVAAEITVVTPLLIPKISTSSTISIHSSVVPFILKVQFNSTLLYCAPGAGKFAYTQDAAFTMVSVHKRDEVGSVKYNFSRDEDERIHGCLGQL